jgi:hypothetical protein
MHKLTPGRTYYAEGCEETNMGASALLIYRNGRCAYARGDKHKTMDAGMAAA